MIKKSKKKLKKQKKQKTHKNSLIRSAKKNKSNNISNKIKRTPRIKKFKTNKHLIKSLTMRCLIPKDKVFAFQAVDRLNYMNEKYRGEIGYMDRPSGLILEQTISAPHMHAYAVKLLSKKLFNNGSILDVGCGSGYLTAIFGYYVGVHKNSGNVVGIDIYDEIVKLSIDNIKRYNPELYITNRINIVKSDGWLGYPPKLKKPLYDCIHVGARADKLPLHLWHQLKPGGMILIPIGNEQFSQMKIYIKPQDCGEYGSCYQENDLSVRYVPLQKTKEFIYSSKPDSNIGTSISLPPPPPSPKEVLSPPSPSPSPSPKEVLSPSSPNVVPP